MKKALSLLLALALCLCLTCTALAEVTLTSVAAMNDAYWIAGSSLLRVETNNGYHVLRVDGTDLTGEAYGRNLEYKFGHVIAAHVNAGLNAVGAFDELGNNVIPYAYGVVDILSTDWAVAIKLQEATGDVYDYTSSSDSTKHYIIETADIYNLKKKACVATLARTAFKDADVVGNIINIEDRTTGVITSYDADFNALGTVKYSFSNDYVTPELVTYRENGRYGLKDAQGNVVMEPSYFSINEFYGDYAMVYDGSKYGLIDRTGKLVVPMQYDSIRRNYYGPYDPKTGEQSYPAAGYFCVVSDKKVGFVNSNGEVTCEPKYSEKILDIYGAAALYTDMENQMHLLSADNVDTIVDYKYFHCMDGSSGLLFKATSEDSKYGVVDWHGNVVLPCEYTSIYLSGDGRYLLVLKDYKSMYELFSVDFGMGTAAAVAEAPAVAEEPATADAAASAGTLGTVDARAAISGLISSSKGEEAPAQAQTEEPAKTVSGLTDAKVIVGSVITLLEADAVANKLTITMLLDDVLVLTDNASVQTIVTSVKTLIEADAAANAASAVTLLRSVETLL